MKTKVKQYPYATQSHVTKTGDLFEDFVWFLKMVGVFILIGFSIALGMGILDGLKGLVGL